MRGKSLYYRGLVVTSSKDKVHGETWLASVESVGLVFRAKSEQELYRKIDEYLNVEPINIRG